jgi:hypothetical protein
MNLGDNVISLIRTYVPMAVGFALSLFVSHGLNVDPSLKITLTALITSGLSAAWYTLVRLLESMWPGFGWLLGVAKTPAYGTEDKGVMHP